MPELNMEMEGVGEGGGGSALPFLQMASDGDQALVLADESTLSKEEYSTKILYFYLRSLHSTPLSPYNQRWRLHFSHIYIAWILS